MFLRLNEEEIIDSICFIAAEELNCEVDEVDVTEVRALNDGDINAHVRQLNRMFNKETLDLEDIENGIVMFLCELHNFSPEALVIRGVNHDKHNGFWAEVTVGE